MSLKFTDEWFSDECDKLKPKIFNLQNDNPIGSIVFCAYNEEDYLIPTLKSISEITTNLPIEVLAVNNASSDRTKDILFNSGVKVIDEKKKGISYARNAGLEEAKGEIIFQTDADTIVPCSWIDAHYREYNNENIGGVSGPIKYDGVHYLYYLYRSGAIGYHILLDLLGVVRNARGGANLSYKKNDALEIGGFELGSDLGEDVLLFNKLGKIKNLSFPRNKELRVITSGRRYDTKEKVIDSIKSKLDLALRRLYSKDGIVPNQDFLDIR